MNVSASSCRRPVILAALTLLVVAATATQLPAQPRDPLEGLLRGFIESQLDRHLSDDRPQVVNNVPVEVQKARNEAAAMNQDVAQLVRQLQHEIYRVPALRASLAEMQQVQADTAVLYQRLMHTRDLEPVRDEYAHLDTHWRDAAYQLQNTHYVSQAAINLAAQASQHNENLSRLIGVNSHLDRHSLISAVASMDTELRRMIEDIEYELAGSPHRRSYVYHTQQQRQHAQALAALIRDGGSTRDDMTARYNQMRQQWSPLASSLHQQQNRLLNRDIQRVESSQRELAALLRLQVALDRGYLRQQVQLLDDDVHDLYNNVTLAQLVDLGGAGDSVAAARAFHEAIATLLETIDDNRISEDDLVEVYWYLDEQWPAMQAAFQNLQHDQVQQQLQQIDARFVTLRQTLGVQSRLDRRAALQAAQQLHAAAQHLEHDIEELFDNNRYPDNFEDQLENWSEEFEELAGDLYKNMTAGVPIGRLRAQSDAVIQSWSRLQTQLPRFAVQHRGHLIEQGNQITPLVVKLNTYLRE